MPLFDPLVAPVEVPTSTLALDNAGYRLTDVSRSQHLMEIAHRASLEPWRISARLVAEMPLRTDLLRKPSSLKDGFYSLDYTTAFVLCRQRLQVSSLIWVLYISAGC